MWKAGLANFDDIKNDHQQGNESARSTYSLSRSRRDKLTAVLEKQNSKPRIQTKRAKYRNPPLQEKFRGSRSNSRRSNNSRRSRYSGNNVNNSTKRNANIIWEHNP